MTRLETLQALKSRIAEAKGPDREIDALLWAELDDREVERQGVQLVGRKRSNPSDAAFLGHCGTGIGLWTPSDSRIPAFTSSLDAVVALIEREIPEVAPCVGMNIHHGHWHGYLNGFGPLGASGDVVTLAKADHKRPALALLSAFISALIAKEQSNG